MYVGLKLPWWGKIKIFNQFCSSWNGYNDELVWGAAWLAKAGETSYLSKAESYYSQFGLDELTGVFSWDDKAVGCSALLAELTGKSTYVNALKTHCDDATSRQTSQGGEVWWDYPWGSLRYAANSALICLQVWWDYQCYNCSTQLLSTIH